MKPNNFTRYSHDLGEKFRRAHRYDLLALYHILRLSDFAREGIANSGSYRFADHMYRNQPSGRNWLGRRLDRFLLNLPATAAMRSRCARATTEMERAFRLHQQRHPATPFRVLTIPCGLPRDVRDFVSRLTLEERSRIEYVGLDIDPKVVADAEVFLEELAVRSLVFRQCNALASGGFETYEFDFISSTGLGEFLDDADLAIFYRNIRRALATDGVFFTSAAGYEARSEWLLRTYEFDTRYRDEPALRRVLDAIGWRDVTFDQHPSGLQTFLRAQ